MIVVCDIEANALVNPSQIWLIVCKDVASGEYHIFREVTTDAAEKKRFLAFAQGISLWIGHNILGYDLPVLNALCGLAHPIVPGMVVDTLIISKLVDYSRDGHSIEQYGEEFGVPKGKFVDFSKYSKEMEDYCVRDVAICHRVYLKYLSIIDTAEWQPSIGLEHSFQLIVNALHNRGFCFDVHRAEALRRKVEKELQGLDEKILEAFPPREVLIREFTPKLTKHGTISRSSVPRLLLDRLHEYEAGVTYRHTKKVEFNPASHKQIIQVLNESGWRPTDKTQSHIDLERDFNRLRYSKQARSEVDIASKELILNKLEGLRKTGWKVNEANLSTLPASAPEPARLLAKRILLESRRRTLTEWLDLVHTDGRVHGKFYGIGAWTQRMAHQKPNTANITSEFHLDGKPRLLGKELRQLWRAPKNRLLVGVDAEGIQLRIFAHYIDDKEFTNSLVNGNKDDKTDPHNLNKRILGDVCKSRAAAKRFIFALLLGAGIGKLAQILEASEDETRRALERLLERYTGFADLKKNVIPGDAKRGYFKGIDGRLVKIPGETPGERKHLCMSGYLQNGEAVVIKSAAVLAVERLNQEKIDCFLTNIVHDEFVIETRNDVHKAEYVKEVYCKSIEEIGIKLRLKCPLAGDGSVGLTWYDIH